MKTPYRRRMPVSKEKFGILAVFVFAISLVGCGSEVEADKRYNSAQTTKGSSQFVRLGADVVEEFGLDTDEEVVLLALRARDCPKRTYTFWPKKYITFGGFRNLIRKFLQYFGKFS